MEKAYEAAYGMEAADRRAGELQASKAAAAGSASVNKVADKKPPTTTTAPPPVYDVGRPTTTQTTTRHRNAGNVVSWAILPGYAKAQGVLA